MANKLKLIAFATPTLGSVSIEWASVFRSIALPLNVGMTNFFVRDSVGGEIAETRNRCVQLALSAENDGLEISHIFWLDDDVICTRLSLLKLLSHNRDIASGVYFTRCEASEPLIFPHKGGGTTPFVPDQAFETWGHGSGLTLVRLSVYKRMAQELDLGRDKYGRPQWYKTPGIADATVENGVAFVGGSEDLLFLDQAAKLGIRGFVDTSRLAFGWHWDARTNQGYPLKQWRQQQAGKAIEWETPDGVKVWEQ